MIKPKIGDVLRWESSEKGIVDVRVMGYRGDTKLKVAILAISEYYAESEGSQPGMIRTDWCYPDWEDRPVSSKLEHNNSFLYHYILHSKNGVCGGCLRERRENEEDYLCEVCRGI